MWTIQRIEAAEFGDEERMPGEPKILLITLESDDGSEMQFEVAEGWIESQNLSEGDEWPEDIEAEDADAAKTEAQNAWMENYYSALEELEA